MSYYDTSPALTCTSEHPNVILQIVPDLIAHLESFPPVISSTPS